MVRELTDKEHKEKGDIPMSIDDVKQTLGVNFSHVVFDYAGEHCGVDPLAADRFVSWCGDEEAEFKSVDELVDYPFFKGKKLKEICDKVEFM